MTYLLCLSLLNLIPKKADRYHLRAVSGLLPDYPDLEDLVKIFRELPETDEKLLPTDSLLREFIGGSELNY